jgi:hypothetical protein
MDFADRAQGGSDMKALAFAGVVALVMSLALASPAGARFQEPPAVDIQGVAGLAPDGGSIGVQLLAECPERWTVVEAVVRVSQPSGAGQASFPLTCIASPRLFGVSVPATTGTFQLGEGQVSATVVIKRGKTARADDSQVVSVQPTVLVELAESGQLVDGGQAVLLDVTVACPAGTSGLESRLVVSQAGRVIGVGTYTPFCDRSRHTFTVRVQASDGVYEPGIAQALTFATIEWQGEVFYGIDDDGALELVA